MAMIDVTLNLPEELVEEAKEYGALTNASIAALLDAEVKRLKSRRDFQKNLEGLHAASREHFGDLSEDEIMGLIDAEVKEVRAERRKRQQDESKP